AGVELAAVAVVVAHLHRLGKTAPALRRVGFVFRPVEHGLEGNRAVARRVAEQRAVVLLRGPHDLAGIEQSFRVEELLDLAERARQLRAEKGLDALRAAEA